MLSFSLPSLSLPAQVADLLPEGPIPWGRSDLPEVRTVRELRPGLSHIHIERGELKPRPKLAFTSATVDDPTKLIPFREALEQTGYTVTQHQISPPGTPKRYLMLAGEFDSAEKLRKAAREVSIPVLISSPVYYHDWDQGPWALDIVVLDPKTYRGKIVSAWSGKAWRASPLQLAIERGAVVAINAGFFEYSVDGVAGVMTGTSIVEGEWHHEPQPRDHNAPILFIENDAEGKPTLSVGYDAPPLPQFKWGDGKSVTLDGIDRMPRENELVTMKRAIIDTSPLSHYIPPGLMIRQIDTEGILSWGSVVESGPILMATGNKQAILEEAMESGKPVELDLHVANRPSLNAFYGVPMLRMNGETVAPQWTLYKHPRVSRTVAGADAKGRIYLISIEETPFHPRYTSGFIGANMYEVKELVEHLGLINAINLDGGGRSTSMVIEEKVMGISSDYWAITPYDDYRRVGDSILIIDEDQ